MVLEAIKYARENLTTSVVVLVNTLEERQRIVHGLPLEDVTLKEFHVLTLEMVSGFDWETMNFPESKVLTKVFVDHALIEGHFEEILIELHRYDRKPNKRLSDGLEINDKGELGLAAIS